MKDTVGLDVFAPIQIFSEKNQLHLSGPQCSVLLFGQRHVAGGVVRKLLLCTVEGSSASVATTG